VQSLTPWLTAALQLLLSKYLSRNESQAVKFEATVVKQGMAVAAIEGIIYFKNVPSFAQMKSGKHTDTGILGGTALLPDLPLPKGIINTQPLDPSATPSYAQHSQHFSPQVPLAKQANWTSTLMLAQQQKAAHPAMQPQQQQQGLSGWAAVKQAVYSHSLPATQPTALPPGTSSISHSD
jgi:hypothetical protein